MAALTVVEWAAWLMKESTWTGTDTAPSGRHEIPSVRPRSARPDRVRCGCGCQKLVQPTICPHSHMPLEVWACLSSHRAPHSAPNTQDPYFCSARGDHPGHLTYRLHITPRTLRSSACTARSSQVRFRCRLAPAVRAMAMSSSYDASGHDLSVLLDTLRSDIIVLSSRSNRAGVIVCALAT